MVRFGEHRIQIIPTNGRLNYAKAKVEVQERMDGSLAVYYKGQCLATRPAPPEAPWKPGPDHPWRRRFKMYVDR